MVDALNGGRYRRCSGKVTSNVELLFFSGTAISKRAAEPHDCTVHSGASRSVEPEMACKARREWEEAYLSKKSVDGRVKYVCKAQPSAGEIGLEVNWRVRVG